MLKIIISLLIYLVVFSACNDGYQQNIGGLAGKKFCLNREATKKLNNILIGNGYLQLFANKTFIIKNDSLQFSDIRGGWDLCCKESDWGNFIFKPTNHIKQVSANPSFEIMVQGKIYTLIFTTCNE